MPNDLTDRQQSEDALKVALGYAENIIATLREPFVVLNRDLRVNTANRSFFEAFHVSKAETEDRLIYDLGDGQWDIPLLRTLLNEVLSNSHPVHDFEVEHNFPDIGQCLMAYASRGKCLVFWIFWIGIFDENSFPRVDRRICRIVAPLNGRRRNDRQRTVTDAARDKKHHDRASRPCA